MKKNYIFLAVSIVLLSLITVVIFYAQNQVNNEPLPEQISRGACDTNNQCPVGLGHCYKIENEVNPVCLTEHPCTTCESKKCELLETFPEQVKCL